MDETVITWNVPNWITIVLMAFIGFAIVGVATQLLLKAKGSSDA